MGGRSWGVCARVIVVRREEGGGKGRSDDVPVRQELRRQQEMKHLPNPALEHHKNTLIHTTTTSHVHCVWAPVLILT